MAAVSAMGVHKDSPFKNPKQIPYPNPSPPLVQNLVHAEEEDS